MKIILIEPYENGARPAPQDWWRDTPPEGYAFCPDEFFDVFYSTSPAGFVNITVEENIVTEMTVNQEALNAYVAANPEEPEPDPEPTTEERVTALEEQMAQADETAIELYEANLAQEEINAAQDDALIELYELIGG